MRLCGGYNLKVREALREFSWKMKFGNYNLTTATEKHRHLFVFRIRKVKTTANYIVGKFHNKIGTIATLRHLKLNSEITENGKRAESPLSYRESLFEKDAEIRRIMPDPDERFSPQDFHQKHFNKDNINFYILNQMNRNRESRHTISGRRKFFNSNLYRTLENDQGGDAGELEKDDHFDATHWSSRSSSALNSQVTSSLQQLIDNSSEPDVDEEYNILKDYFDSMSYTDILKDNNFKNYLNKKKYLDAIEYIYGNSLKSYHSEESLIYEKIWETGLNERPDSNDCDSIKQWKQLSTSQIITPTISRAKELQNHFVFSNDTQFFYKRNREFDEFYKNRDNHQEEEEGESESVVLEEKYTTRDYNDSISSSTLPRKMWEGNKKQTVELPSFITLPRQRENWKNTFNSSVIDNSQREQLQTPPQQQQQKHQQHQTQPFLHSSTKRLFQQKPQRPPQPPPKPQPKRDYSELLKLCEKSLTNYVSTIDYKLQKWRKFGRKPAAATPTTYSDKNYNKIIKCFVKARGFSSVDDYVQHHYGRILEKSMKIEKEMSSSSSMMASPSCTSTLSTSSSLEDKFKLRDINYDNDLLPPPYTSGNYLKNSYYNSLLHDDCFKNYEYINYNTMNRKLIAATDSDLNLNDGYIFEYAPSNEVMTEYDEYERGEHCGSAGVDDINNNNRSEFLNNYVEEVNYSNYKYDDDATVEDVIYESISSILNERSAMRNTRKLNIELDHQHRLWDDKKNKVIFPKHLLNCNQLIESLAIL